MTNSDCSHCRGAGYVLPVWLEEALQKNGIHLTDLPPSVIKTFPLGYFCHCHCNVGILFYARLREESAEVCPDCELTTWRFTEQAKLAGYWTQKLFDLSVEEITALPCGYFERCHCGPEAKAPRRPKRKRILQEIFGFLKLPIPQFGFIY